MTTLLLVEGFSWPARALLRAGGDRPAPHTTPQRVSTGAARIRPPDTGHRTPDTGGERVPDIVPGGGSLGGEVLAVARSVTRPSSGIHRVVPALPQQRLLIMLAHTFAGYPSLSGSITKSGRQLMRHDDMD